MSRISIIPTEKILERLRYENPWWINKRIPEVFSKMARRIHLCREYERSELMHLKQLFQKWRR